MIIKTSSSSPYTNLISNLTIVQFTIIAAFSRNFDVEHPLLFLKKEKAVTFNILRKRVIVKVNQINIQYTPHSSLI